MGCKKQMCSPKRVISNTQTTTTKERTMPRICIPSSYLKAQAMLQGTTWWRRRWGDAGVQDQCPCCPRTWESGLPAGRWFGGHSCTPGSIKSSNTKFSLQWNSSLKHQATVVLREGFSMARLSSVGWQGNRMEKVPEKIVVLRREVVFDHRFCCITLHPEENLWTGRPVIIHGTISGSDFENH